MKLRKLRSALKFALPNIDKLVALWLGYSIFNPGGEHFVLEIIKSKIKVIDAEIVDDYEVQQVFPVNLLLLKELRLILKTFFSGISVVICLVGLILFAWSNPTLQPVFVSVATYVIHNFVKVYMF